MAREKADFERERQETDQAAEPPWTAAAPLPVFGRQPADVERGPASRLGAGCIGKSGGSVSLSHPSEGARNRALIARSNISLPDGVAVSMPFMDQAPQLRHKRCLKYRFLILILRFAFQVLCRDSSKAWFPFTVLSLNDRTRIDP